ncbi:MAG: TonB-dependent receptor [Acidobacteriia bacterium]|nr:TonB-dependent receptor [Terriglobia bacterium]
MRSLLTPLLFAWALCASEHHGEVRFGGLPVPGVTITASRAGQTLTAVTDPQGVYSFPDLADGTWAIRIEMLGFSPIEREIAVAPGAPSPQWELKMLPFDEIKAAGPPAPPPPTPALSTTGLQTAPPPPVTEARNKTRKGKAPIAPANTKTPFQRAQLNAAATAPAPANEPAANENAGELNQRASDGFLINGSANNGATSPFALGPAFGNARFGSKSLYNGSIGVIVDNSGLDARSYSLTGQDTSKPAYNHVTGVLTFGGPLKIPHIWRNGPNFFIGYQWTRNRNATTETGLVPTAAQRNGDLSQTPGTSIDPSNGLPFPGNTIPRTRLSPQALALLSLYPLPNFNGGTSYNYQIPVVGATHQDAFQARMNKAINRKNLLSGVIGYQNIRTDSSNLFGFLDNTDSAGINTQVNWRHTFTQRLYGNLGLQFSRLATRITPFFANRENISGAAGITGNNQDPLNWGPPSLAFASGITALSDATATHNRNQTSAVSYDLLWNHFRHNVSFGGDFRRQEFNYWSQQNPRGAFSFTGAATGSDLAGFLLGIPDTSSIAFGNADKYLRASLYDAYITDDWRIGPSFTLNAGVRWEYSSPITELYGRLVNLDIASGYSAEAPVIASNPLGALTGRHYPDSLMNPDKHGFQPRIGFSWRPFSASSMVVRGGYGVYYNTSVYQSIAIQMAQQYPLSKSLSVQNSAASPLTLADGFNVLPATTRNTFAADPNFRIGYAQNWQLSVQRDLPWSLQMVATYLGIKGTRGMQEFFPNTYPLGGVNPCPTCPSGYAYLTSNGNSTREAGQLQLRRRLHNGITATLQYTFSKSIDDATLGGRTQPGTLVAGGVAGQTGPATAAPGPSPTTPAAGATGSSGPSTSTASAVVAQNWLDLSAERGLSNFDQRHLVTLQAQYTTGIGVRGGALASGWKGGLFKEWTVVTQLTAGTGLPLNPVYFAPTAGTATIGNLRPDYTGAPLYDAPVGRSLNPAAFVAPLPGQFGNAGRNSITGPSQFSLNASLQRTFRMNDRLTLDLRVDSTNPVNHVTFPSWDTIVGNAQFGLPTEANAMRSLQTNLRLRF